MKICVGVFFGGKSTEHEISCISANQAIHALDSDKYDVLPIYISKDNEFYIGDELFDLANYSSFISNPSSVLEKVMIYKDGNNVKVRPMKGMFKKERTIDVAFPIVHGTNVEDGSLAGFLQMLDIPYTSCDVLGGAVGQDKTVMKDIFKAEGIPMVDYFVVYNADFEDAYEDYFKKAKKIGFPLIAKPANLGSSIGIEVIKTEEEFQEKISECLKYDFKVVVEKMIANLKEVNISIIGGDEKAKCSAIEEVTNGFLDFDKKYQPGSGSKGAKKGVKVPAAKGASKGMASTVRKVPAELKEGQKEEIEKIALKVFRALNSFGCVRIDFMIDNDTDKVYCNEINTIPGSLAFYLWKEEGVDFSQECDELINNALNRYARRSRKTYSFDTNILDNYAKK
ncbi:MAG: D-alanine--D-alanine ligase [Erysipelotrichaceae bacterium]|nr:D-alanine--D-alanine ligase [Erysipelotrichaceae bacterium]MBQ9158328.1 D-alanine--D-alanine ligase [Erysipelotrichaceae bacterium]MBR4609761.1 D-alanine--D-alanine ligase [Erysipelotrichaceae bacterium]